MSMEHIVLAVDARLKLIKKYDRKISELELLKEMLDKDIKELYQNLPYARMLYEALQKLRDSNTKSNQKAFKDTLAFCTGSYGLKYNFKFDFKKIANVNYSKSYSIDFTYGKERYRLLATNPNQIEIGDFIKKHLWISDLSISISKYEKSSNNSMLLGYALTDSGLKQLIEDKIINRKDNEDE